MSNRPRFTPLIEGLPTTIPFVGPESLERRMGVEIRLRLGANESRFGISPLARQALMDDIDRAPNYADPEHLALRTALARTHGVPVANILIASGIDDLLGLVARVLVSDGSAAVTSEGTYPTFNYHVAGYGGRIVEVPYLRDVIDVDALATAAKCVSARVVYLANPDNPSGTFHPRDAVQRLLDQLPEECVLALDEAYADFAPPHELLPVDISDARVIRLRTFSKAHGLAGLRIGYAILHEVAIEAFNKVRLHFGVSRAGVAAAHASLSDAAFAENVVQEVSRGREHYASLATELALRPIASSTNFVAMDTGSDEVVRALLVELMKQGVFVRSGTKPPMNRCIRVTVGLPEERAEFAAILRKLLPIGRPS